jgi:hypothetical protein
MYQITRTFRRTNRQQGRWEEYPLADEPVLTLTETHGDVWIFLTYPMLQGEERALRFDKVRNLLVNTAPTTTVQEWLTSLGNQTLPVEASLPEFKERFVTYASAWHAGYEVIAIGRGASADQNASKFNKEDLRLTKDDVTPEYLRKHAMVSVNGFFHMTEYDHQGVYVREGNRSVRHANENQVGVHSFADIGEINYVPITEAMITSKREDTPLREGCYITLPGTVDLTGKTALLVAGGYLQVMDRTYQRVGDRTWRIHLGRLSLVERYYDSKDWIDLSALNFTEYENNPSLISLTEMFKDETIIAYLTLPQSFVVLVNTDNLFQEYLPIEHAGVPGRWLEYQFNQYPAIGAYGKALEYHPTQEGEITVVNGMESKMHAYDFQTRPWRKKPGLDGSRYPAKPFEHTQAFWRVLGTIR